MDLIAHFTRLFAYDGWANQEVLNLMAHIFSSERLWMERLEQKPQSLPVWPEFSIAECEKQAAELPELWRLYLAGNHEASLAEPVSYQNSKGETWSSRKDDILMHLITHSAYHRGQVAATVRTAGSVPAYTNFIHSVRQGFVK
jgi:uncharacterized damage-inducible protein DinB